MVIMVVSYVNKLFGGGGGGLNMYDLDPSGSQLKINYEYYIIHSIAYLF